MVGKCSSILGKYQWRTQTHKHSILCSFGDNPRLSINYYLLLSDTLVYFSTLFHLCLEFVDVFEPMLHPLKIVHQLWTRSLGLFLHETGDSSYQERSLFRRACNKPSVGKYKSGQVEQSFQGRDERKCWWEGRLGVLEAKSYFGLLWWLAISLTPDTSGFSE
jgi:hypothetical protein